MNYIDLYKKNQKILEEQVQAEFNNALKRYCEKQFGSAEYYQLIHRNLDKGVLAKTNENCWTDSFPYACSPYIKATELIRSPVSFQILPNDTSIPPITRSLADLSLIIKRLQLVNAQKVIVADFGLFLYILFASTSEPHKVIQNAVRQFLYSISSASELNNTEVELIMQDSLAMFNTLKEWNIHEHSQRMRRYPFYTEWSFDRIAEMYSLVCPTFKDFRTNQNEFNPPHITFKASEFLTKFDRFLLTLYFNKYGDSRTALKDEELFKVINSRDKYQAHAFAEKYFEYKDLRKLYLVGRKRTRCCDEVPFKDPVISVWRSHLRHKSTLCTYERYDPFERGAIFKEIFANTVLDFYKLEEECKTVTKQKIKEIYLMAQTINQVRKLNYSEDPRTMFMSLNVDVINAPPDRVEEIREVLASATENLKSTYMDEFTFTIHEDFNSFRDYVKHPFQFELDPDYYDDKDKKEEVFDVTDILQDY